MPWLMFQSDGHLVVSMVNPFGPTYMSLLLASWPYLPVPAAGMTAPAAPPAAVVAAPPAAVVVLPAGVGAPPLVGGAARGAPPLPPLFSLPHAAGTTPRGTRCAARATPRVLLLPL